MNKRFCAWAVGILSVGFLAGGAKAGHAWLQWRGPNFDGSSEAANLPETIDKNKPAWATQLPGVGNGTPVIVGDRIFVSCADPNSAKLLGICISLADGHILW